MIKNADLITVQIEVDITSLLDGLQKVLDECQNQSEAGQNVQGNTVVQIAAGHEGDGEQGFVTLVRVFPLQRVL